MIPLFKVRTNLCGEAIDKVLASGYTGQGSQVELLETELQKRLRSSTKPLTVNSCTAAIDLSISLCNVGPGDEVISTPYTCFATQVPMLYARNAVIKWADIDPLTGNIDPNSVADLITEKTKAIIGVDWAGRPINVFKLWKAANYSIPVIRDAAHTWEPKLNGPDAEFTCYSFQSIKFLQAGDGGCLVVSNREKYREAKLKRWYGLDREQGDRLRCLQNIEKPGFKYHMNDIIATIALANLDLAGDSVRRHKENARKYDQALGDLTSITIPPPDTNCSYWLYSLLVNKGTKEEFIEHLKQHGIEASPVHIRNDNYTCTKEFKRPLPGVDEFSKKQVSIPVGWYLTDTEIDHIIHTIRSY